MRKNLLALAAFSGILFTSCSNEMDQIVEQQKEQNAIGFSTYSMMSKGAPITGNEGSGPNDNPFAKNGSSFEVAAFLNDKTNPYLKAQITYNSGWNYASLLDKAYWPNGANDKLNFFAVAPYSDFYPTAKGGKAAKGTVTYANNEMKITYTVPTETNKQQDLMYATTAPMGKNETQNGNVPLNFKHALNQIHFMGKTDSENLRVEIAANGIQVCNIKNSGTLTATSTSSSWAAGESKVNYTIETVESETVAAPVIINSTSTAISNPSNVLMLVPQTVTKWDLTPSASKQENSYLKINCKIWVNNGGSEQDKVYLHGDASAPALIYVPFAGTSMTEMGKKITYTLIFGGGYTDEGQPILTPITFTTTVKGWDTNL